MSKNTITQEHVDEIIKKTKIVYETFGNKTLVGVCTLPNGWVEVFDASCIDPENFDFEVGKDIILKRLNNKIWELEGYLLQCKLSGW